MMGLDIAPEIWATSVACLNTADKRVWLVLQFLDDLSWMFLDIRKCIPTLLVIDGCDGKTLQAKCVPRRPN